MSDAPERIVIHPDSKYWAEVGFSNFGPIGYIRADLVAAQIAAAVAKERDENKLLRELLAMAYSGAHKLYTYDGEMLDSSENPFIDYYRDSAEQIKESIHQRGLNEIKGPQ